MPILDEIESPVLRDLYLYWEEQRRGRRMPSRTDLDPVEMMTFLPWVVLLDIEHNPRRYRFRVMGTAAADGYGEDLTGRYHGELDFGAHNIEPDATLAETMETGLPTHMEIDFESGRAVVQHLERIVLPLSSDGRDIDKLLCGVFYESPRSRRPADRNPDLGSRL